MDGKYNETISILADMSKVKMTMNAHKGNIEELKTVEIIEMMEDEVKELIDAIANKGLMETIEEAADVMNFLVALTHQQIEKYRDRKNIHEVLSELNKKDIHQ